MDPALPAGLRLPDGIKALVNGALDNGAPMVVAAVSPAGEPLLSFRGSTHVYSDDQLAFWMLRPDSSAGTAIRLNPAVALMYRSPATPMLKFTGRARISSDPVETARVFEGAPEREQKSDPERRGAAVIIDIDTVEAVLSIGPDGPVLTRLKRI